MNKRQYEVKTLEELYYIQENLYNKLGWSIGLSGMLPLTLEFFPEIVTFLLVGGASCNLVKILRNLNKNSKTFYELSLEYQTLLSSYQEVLREVTNLFHEMEWDNEAKIFAGYSYLLKQGYLSYEHEFRYAVNTGFVDKMFGVDVIRGLGNCKHINTMLSDLLILENYSTYRLGMNLDHSVSYLNDMKLLISKNQEGSSSEELVGIGKVLSDILFKVFEKMDPSNHLVTLVCDNEHSYVMDACNDTIFGVDLEKNIVQNNHIFDVRLSSIIKESKNVKLKDILKPTLESKLEQRLDDYSWAWNMCFSNQDIFEKFYLEHKDMYFDVLEKRRVLKKKWLSMVVHL